MNTTTTPPIAPLDPGLLDDLVACARAIAKSGAISALSSAAVADSMKDLKKVRGAVSSIESALRNRAQELQPTPDPTPFPKPNPDPADRPDPVPDSGEPVDVSPETLDHASGITTRTGRTRDRHARVLHQMPAIDEALTAGDITDHHVDELAKILFTATDAVWKGITAAQTDIAVNGSRLTPVAFATYLTALVQQIAAEHDSDLTRDLETEISASIWIDQNTGLGHLRATFDPRNHTRIDTLISRAAAKLRGNNRHLTKKQANGHALLQLLTQPDRDNTDTGAQITVIVDERTLFAGHHAGSISEHTNGTPIPITDIQELACTATLTPILHDGYGIAIDIGRARRYASPAQRQALETMYATCFHTDCDIPVTHCHAHHITYWNNGGRTDLNNLLPTCEHHHRWIHANNPTITLNEKRVATVTMPNGTTTHHHPNRQPERQPATNTEDRNDETRGLPNLLAS
jgi:hypothetical protein